MTRNTKWFLPILLTVITVGCRTVGKEYSFKLILVEGPRDSIKQIYDYSGNSDMVCSDEKFSTGLAKSRTESEIKLTEFPVVHANVGDEIVVDKRIEREFPDEFDETGSPTKYTKSKFGERVKISCKGIRNGGVTISYDFHTRVFSGWDTSFPGFKMPIFSSHEASCSDARFDVGVWTILYTDLAEIDQPEATHFRGLGDKVLLWALHVSRNRKSNSGLSQ